MIALFFILYIIFHLITILVIVGANKNKTEEEKALEDEEQMNYLKNYNIFSNKYRF